MVNYNTGGGTTGITVTVAAPTGLTATDTPNITSAITSLGTALGSGPATLLFRDGTYQVDSNALVIRSLANFTIRGTGGTVLAQAPVRSGAANNVGGDLFIIADCSDFTVQDLTLDGLRDTVAPMTALTASASSGQPSVTVAAGQGARYLATQTLSLFGGLTTADSNQQDANLTVLSITAGGGAGGGDLITFTTNLANTYTHVSGSALSDGFGPYAYNGAYLTPYQTGSATVAGRTMTGEDQQNGLHLLNCQRFVIAKVTARNLWESAVKCGTGFAATALTDGCQLGRIADCTGYHGYDQGISLWLSNQITVEGCALNAAGWAGVSMSGSDRCSILGNEIINSYYRVPNDNNSGSGIAIEGGVGNEVKGNIILTPWSDGMRVTNSPVGFSQNSATAPTTSAYLAAQTAAGTSVQVSATAHLQQGGLYSILDGSRTEAVSVASIVDGTHVKFNEIIQFSHASGVYLSNRVSQDNVIDGNTIYQPQQGNGINAQVSVRSKIKGNVITGWGLQASSNVFGVRFDYSNSGSATLPSGVYIAGNSSIVEGNRIGGGYAESVYTDSTDGLVISGNRLSGPVQGTSPCLHLKGVVDSVISGNQITDVEQQGGIYIESGSLSSTVTARCVISDNTVKRTSNEGIIILTGDSLSIRGNTVSGCGGDAGINPRGVTNSVIANNICNSNQNAGIKLEDNSSAHCLYNRVTGNTCRDDASGFNITNGNTWTQAHGIVEAGNSNFNVFVNNECDSNGTDQLTTVGTSSYVFANTLSNVPSVIPVTYAQPWQAADSAYLAWSMDPAVASSASALNSGTIYVTRINVRTTISVTNVIFFLQAAGSVLTASQCFAGLYAGQTAGGYTAGNQIAVSADQHTAWTSAGPVVSALTSGPFTLVPGFYWVAFLANESGGTMPSLSRSGSGAVLASITNAGTSSSSYRSATAGTGQTTLPGTLGALTSATSVQLAALS